MRSTFEVAVSTYQFFTGSAPTTAGIAYLRGDAGAGNANGLNSAYYAQFNEENRYYNFAVNLATASSSSTSFANNYGSLTFGQTVSAAYENIVGSGNVGATQAAAAIADITSRMAFFQQIAATRGGDASALTNPNGSIVLKAVVVGYILEEANKADVGTYAKAIDQFEASVAAGNSISGANLLTTYTPGGAGFGTGIGGSGGTVGGTQSNFTLTTGTDAPTNTTGNVQYIGSVNATTPAQTTLNASDQIRASGANNTLTVDTTGAVGDATGGALISGIQTINVRATAGSTAALDANLTPGATTFNAFLAPGSVTFSNLTSGSTAGIVGNGTVTSGGFQNFGYLASATTATLNLSGGTIGTVGGAFGTGANITGAGLTTVNVTSSGVGNSLSNLTVQAPVTTLNITANAGSALTFASTNVGQNAAGTAGTLTTINVSGASAVNLGTINNGTAAGTEANTIRTFTSTNTGGVTAQFAAAASAGAAPVAQSMTITTAAGAVDRLTIDGAVAGASVINLGGGTATTGDSITFTGILGAGTQVNGGGNATIGLTQANFQQVSSPAVAGGFSAAQRQNITGFSTVLITDALANGATYDVNTIGATNLTTVGVAAGGTATLNTVSGGLVTFTNGIGTNTGTLLVDEAGATQVGQTTDVLNLSLTGQSTSNTLNVTAVTGVSAGRATGIETVNITANRATGNTTALATLNVVDAAATTYNVSGNEAVRFVLAAAHTQLTTVNGSGLTAATGNVIDVANVTGRAGVFGTATAATPFTLTGGTGADTLGFQDYTNVRGGAGNDILHPNITTSGQTYSSFLDATAGDTVVFSTTPGAYNANTTGTVSTAKITLNPTAVFQDYLDAATGAGRGTFQVSAFDFGGDTYLVQNFGPTAAGGVDAVTFQNGFDAVIRLVGIHTLATTSGAGVAVIGS